MSTMAAAVDASQLAALSERLGIPARQLLIAAARLAEAEPQRRNDPDYLRRVIDDAKHADAAAQSSVELLLTPIAEYAINDLDRLFASIWPETGAKQGG